MLRFDRLAVFEAVLEREKLAEPDSVSNCERLAVFDTVPEHEGLVVVDPVLEVNVLALIVVERVLASLEAVTATVMFVRTV